MRNYGARRRAPSSPRRAPQGAIARTACAQRLSCLCGHPKTSCDDRRCCRACLSSGSHPSSTHLRDSVSHCFPCTYIIVRTSHDTIAFIVIRCELQGGGQLKTSLDGRILLFCEELSSTFIFSCPIVQRGQVRSSFSNKLTQEWESGQIRQPSSQFSLQSPDATPRNLPTERS